MNGITALIVDDSSVMRKIVERSLRQAGINLAQVLEAGNGVEALAVLQKSRVDLILCDINMPVMGGLEFVKQLSGIENAKDVPVVMITTEGSESHVVQALSCGARGYIRKPFTPDQVKEHVLPVLRGNCEASQPLKRSRHPQCRMDSAAGIGRSRSLPSHARLGTDRPRNRDRRSF
jgi:two-component system chemotaxis response regulator CheY